MMKYLLSGNASLGVTSIFTSEKIDVALPLNCQAILEIKDGKGMVRKDTNQLLSHLADYFTADSLDKKNSEFLPVLCLRSELKKVKITAISLQWLLFWIALRLSR